RRLELNVSQITVGEFTLIVCNSGTTIDSSHRRLIYLNVKSSISDLNREVRSSSFHLL
ncbi:hypothetical protein U1Q18_014213, partial [Sarracenia purpurea var. burkii]